MVAEIGMSGDGIQSWTEECLFFVLYCNSQICAIYKLKVCDNLAKSKSTDTIFPIAQIIISIFFAI